MRDEPGSVVVIGAGLAGLTAAATAARAGRQVVVVEAHAGGGRARTDERNGFHFNQGPHALYKGGDAWTILNELGVTHHGHMPPLRGAKAVKNGKLVRMFGTSATSLTAKVVSASSSKWAGRSAEEWAQSLGQGGLPDFARMFIRVATYASDLERLPADLAIDQLKMAFFRGVSYLDGGWATLVSGLWAAATAGGATVRVHQAATEIGAVRGGSVGWEVGLADGSTLPASAVVVAAGGPATTLKLLPVDPGWPELGPPVTAACLDLGLRGYRPGLVFGIDEPLYLSPHCPPGDLAPEGGSVVHVLRYGARQAGPDREQLRHHARMAGITDEHIVEERFLADMVVTHVLPSPQHSLAGRPPVEVAGAPGVYLAGDWVGPTGWLADAVIGSGHRAGLLAAQTSAGRRTSTRSRVA